MELTTQSMKRLKLYKKKENICSFNGDYNQIYEETKKETKLYHLIITNNNKKEHTCVIWSWDNIKAAKKRLAQPKQISKHAYNIKL